MRIKYFGVIAALCAAVTSVFSQSALTCLPPAADDYIGTVSLNYGYANNSFSTQYRTSGTVGQPLVETGLSTANVSITGYWSQFLVPPLPPVVSASQGDFLDRILVAWRPNPLGAAPSGGYKLFRDGVYQALLDRNTLNYNDYNVIAGKSYRYSVKGLNEYGDGCPSEAVGFMVPNGTVTGWVSSSSGNAVSDVLVSLMPLQGYSLVLDADPVSGAYGGAVAIDTTTDKKYFPTTGTQDYTLTFWVKNKDTITDGTLMEFDGYPLKVRGYGNGIQVFLDSTAVTGKILFDSGTETKWHHIAISHTGQVIRLYVDGNLKILANAARPTGPSPRFFLGNKNRTNSGWRGNLDELRIYHRRLTEIDLREVMAGTASSSTPDLKYYWKFDEQLGDKSFDIINRLKLYFCGAYFSTAEFNSGSRTDIPMVCTSARTDSTGFYTIESASYGTGTTFIARPSRFFYLNWALQFVKNSKSYAILPDFALPPQSTLEMTVYSDGPDTSPQTLLSKKWGNNNFSLKLIRNQSDQTKSDLVIDINGGTGQSVVGQLTTGYTHLALTIDSTGSGSRTITTYVNGTLFSTNVFSNVSGNWSDTTTRWVLGADRASAGAYDNVANFNNFYSGLIDEFVVYNSKLDLATIQKHNLIAREMTEDGLMVYFPLDEGEGYKLNNCGSLPLGFGEAYNIRWSNYVKFPKTEPHEFLPASRQVTLNPSVTSVDQVDYTDISTVPVTGFVRYKNTDCFASGIEITNDGVSFVPRVLTDSVGKFTLDAQPGKSFKLVPKFEDHQFVPALWEVTKVTTPIAGIVFNDITTRTVEVTVAGGDCKVSTLGDNLGTAYNSLKLQIRNAGNDCYERFGTMTNGISYTFTGIPPFSELNVGLFSHENNEIKNAIQALGAITVDVTKRDTAVEFIYRNPELEVDLYEGLEATCNALKYWDPPLPAGATPDSTKLRRWSPPLPLGADPDYVAMKVRFYNTDYQIVNNKIQIDTTIFYYSEYPINLNSGTVNIGSNVYTLTPSDAKLVLEKGSIEIVKLRVKEQYPGGTCILNDADLRFVNGFADELKDTNLVAATYPHSGVLAAPSGNPLANKNIKVRLTLQPAILSPLSEAYYREIHSVKTNGSGGYTVNLGKGVRDTIVKGTFDEVPWYPSADAPFMKVEVDTTTNGNYLQEAGIPQVTHPSTTHTYKFKVGDTNPVSPYYKTLQVIATTPDGRKGSMNRVAVISGTRPNGERFTTYMPERPMMILRDPPGDASYSYISKDSTICQTYSLVSSKEISKTLVVEIDGTPEITTSVGVGAETELTLETGVDVGLSGNHTMTRISHDEYQSCVSLSQTISTSDADLIVGGEQGGDVYIGIAQNMIFGTSDRVQVNNCLIMADQVISIKPGGATGFRYSEYFIKRYLIPYLNLLATEYTLMGKADSAAIMIKSKDSWKTWVKLNEELKQRASFRENVSFDSGVVYESEFTTSHDTLDLTELTNVNAVSSYLYSVVKLNTAGGLFGPELEVTFDQTKTNSTLKSKATTIGYSLSDDDPGDAFSVDVLDDPVFRSPVFKIKSGQSSCPWEKGTASRDKPVLEPVAGYPLQAINIPSKEAAVFRFNLGNNSQSYETRHYNITATGEDNPNGAVIKLNGAVLNSDVDYEVLSNSTVPITITVERGPVEYQYNDLLLEFTSGCEVERADALGMDPAKNPADSSTTINTLAYASQKISVDFIRPCSEVDIDFPRNNYVILRNDLAVTPTNSTVRDIIVNNYSLTDPNFQSIRVQYRRADGNGIWTNILAPATFTGSNPHERWNSKNPDYLAWTGSPQPDTLRPISTAFKWETEGLIDGNYELRAISVCSGPASGMEGSSYYIPIRIDREAPKIVAFEPSDGVYNIGDEISVTFDKPLNTSRFTPPTGNPFGKVDLFDTAPLAGTGLIDVTVTAYENKIFIVPNVLNKFMENKILRLELKDLEDMVGNNTGNNPMKWLNKVPEFYVNRNELAWLTDSVGMTKRLEDTKTIQVNIHNSGGYPVPFEIRDYPNWVHVVPNTGTLAPNEIRAINFTADSTLAFGYWQDSVTLRTLTGVAPPLAFMGGDERIPLGVRVVCSPPEWTLDPGQFENSMNLVLKINVQGTISSDEEDIVGAFIEGQLRGRSHVQFVPQVSYPGNNVYLAYLTVYGSAAELNKPISLRIWDASACLLYGTVTESYTFIPDGINGDANAPATATTNSMVLRQIPLTPGWNWISFNLAFPNPAINLALSSLKYPANDLMKSQTQFANFFGSSWLGSLTTLDNRKMYQYRADKADTIQMLGLCLPDTMSVYVKTGWNWIGYLPSFSLAVNNALSKLSTDGVIQAGDLIKSRTGFAQYIVNPVYTGWLGNLEYMMPPYGYQLKLTKSGVSGAKLTYPAQGLTGDNNPAANRGENMPAFWTVDPSQYESSATLIGMLDGNGTNLTDASMELGAFAGNEVRGAAQAMFVEPLNSYLFFLTYYSNNNGDPIEFKLYDADNSVIYDLAQTMFFTADNHQGSLDIPFPFSYNGLSDAEEAVSQELSLDVRPNPFSQTTEIRFALKQASEVSITVTDLNGKMVTYFKGDGEEGVNALEWKGTSDSGVPLPSGVYFLILKTDAGMAIRKVMLQR